MLDGDVSGAINAAREASPIDMCVGVGGSPEGVATACAIKALGGSIQGRLVPQSDDERQKGTDAGLAFTAFTRPMIWSEAITRSLSPLAYRWLAGRGAHRRADHPNREHCASLPVGNISPGRSGAPCGEMA